MQQNNDAEVKRPQSVSSSTFLGRIGIWKCCFLWRREAWSARKKTSRSEGMNQQQTQPTGGFSAGI